MKPERIITADGSPTYVHPAHGASYRSTRGAATESRLVFLEGSRLLGKSDPWHVLEVGFGAGTNFQNTVQAARQAGVALSYVALEPDPMPADLWLVEEGWKGLRWATPLRDGSVTLTVYHQGWQGFTPDAAAYQAIFHDPFGPAVAPDCWTSDCFRWAAGALASTGVLATYGASSAARQAMKEAGLLVGSLPGAPGKREMTVAAREAQAIAHARPWKR